MLKPVDADVCLIYECTNCKGRHWLTPDEVKVDGFVFVCCGKVHKIKRITKIGLNFNWNKTVKLTQPQVRGKTQKEDAGYDTVKTLMGLGYYKNKAKDMVQKALVTNTNPKELLRDALAKDV